MIFCAGYNVQGSTDGRIWSNGILLLKGWISECQIGKLGILVKRAEKFIGQSGRRVRKMVKGSGKMGVNPVLTPLRKFSTPGVLMNFAHTHCKNYHSGIF